MDFKSEQYGENLVYIFSGEFTAGNWSESWFRDINDKINEGIHQYIFDFGQVTYINSSGVGVLHRAARQITAKQGSVSLVNLPPFVMKIFSNLNLFSVFPVLKSLDDVVNQKPPAENTEPRQA